MTKLNHVSYTDSFTILGRSGVWQMKMRDVRRSGGKVLAQVAPHNTKGGKNEWVDWEIEVSVVQCV